MTTYVFDLSGSLLENSYLDTLDEQITDLLKKRGRIFSCTPLKNFNFKRSEIKKFSEWLSKKVTEDSSNLYKAVITPLNISTNNPFLKVSVEQQNRSTVYEAIFFKWRANENDEPNYHNLPFLYCTGGQKFVILINTLLQMYLGCSVEAFALSQFEFRWLVALSLHHIARTEKDVQLVYENPHIQSKFVFYVSFDVVKDKWNLILNEENNEISYTEVATLHATIVEHVLMTYGFDLNRFQLKVFSIPGFITLDVSGKILIQRDELLDPFYRFLKDKSTSESF